MAATFFNLGGPDLVILLVIVLLLFGARKLPELGRGLGEAMQEFRNAAEEFSDQDAEPGAWIGIETLSFALIIIGIAMWLLI